MKSGVYKICYESYIYIGSAKIFSQRKYTHLYHLRRGTHSNKILQNLFNKYGEENFKLHIIEECEIEFVIEREQYWIDYYKNSKELKLINILMIAGSSLGAKMSKETCEKKRISMLGKNKGKKKPEYDNIAKSIRQKGRIITEEWRKNMSNALKGRKSNGGRKEKKIIEFNNKLYTYREFSQLINLKYSYVGALKLEKIPIFEKRYNCKILKNKNQK